MMMSSFSIQHVSKYWKQTKRLHSAHCDSVMYMRRALGTLTLGRMHAEDVADWLHRNVRLADPELLDSRNAALDDVRVFRHRGRRSMVQTSGAGGATSSSGIATGLHADERESAAGEEDDTSSVYEPPESLYEPPGDSESEGYVSPAATEGLGSVGELDTTGESDAWGEPMDQYPRACSNFPSHGTVDTHTVRLHTFYGFPLKQKVHPVLIFMFSNMFLLTEMRVF